MADRKSTPIDCAIDHQAGQGRQVVVIGAGLAGLMAAVLAVKAGARVRVIAAGWGQQIVTPGWLSVCDRAEDDVIAEVRGYAAMHPQHPYGRTGADALVCGLRAFQDITTAVGLPYDMRQTDGHNLRLPTLLGAIQTPLLAPRGMANGDLTTIDGPVLIVGFEGWRDFHPELVAGNLAAQGIDAQAVRVPLPDGRPGWDDWPVDLARRLDSAEVRATLVRQLQAHVRGKTRVGFPAVLGMEQPDEVRQDLSEGLGCSCFEIPTLPPSPHGTRLSNRLRRWLLRQGARVQVGHPVTCGIVEDGHCTAVEVQALGHHNTFEADMIILATGGLYSGGILSDVNGRLWEPIFDLPVVGPEGEDRTGWYHDDLLRYRGHPIHRHTGLRVNERMQPLDNYGEPVLDNVYAVGHLLAGFNPLTDGCAEGIALASAHKAVCSALQPDAVQA